MRSCFLETATHWERRYPLFHESPHGRVSDKVLGNIIRECLLWAEWKQESGRTGKRFHHKLLIPADPEWKTSSWHYITQANFLFLTTGRGNSGQRQTLLSYAEASCHFANFFVCASPSVLHFHFSHPIGAQIQVLIQMPIMLLTHHLLVIWILICI